MKINFSINKKSVEVDVDPSMPLLWVIRDELKLKGTKYGCGRAMCGACSVHVEGKLVRSCSLPVEYVQDKTVLTIEGLSEDGVLHPVQKAWMEENVPQCGYCQSGFIMATTKLLNEIPNPTDEEINQHISNICRCGTQPRIRKAIHLAAQLKNNSTNE